MNDLTPTEDEEYIFSNHYELGIVRRFEFSSKLQRMSVIVKNANESYYKAFCKGSPEKIKELCKSETIPDDFNDTLSKYTSKGFRVLGIAMKVLKMSYVQSQQVQREVIEKNMIFLGFLIFQNKLKDRTRNTIETLQQANLKMLMATGDNITTAVSVAKECLLINQFHPIYQFDLIKEENNTLRPQLNALEGLNVYSNSRNVYGTSITPHPDSNRSSSIYSQYSGLRPHEEEIRLSTFSKNFDPEVISIRTVDTRGRDSDEEKASPGQKRKQTLKDKELLENMKLDLKPSFFEGIEHNNNTMLAIQGDTFEILYKLYNQNKFSGTASVKYYHDLYKYVLYNTYIFARMSPDHKTMLIEALQEESFIVCMCGDGANDCGALKVADVGVSLSLDDASIAAHFTSNIPDISCIVTLLIEGKASLVTSLQCFKYMMCYSLIQFMSVTILLITGSYLSDNQFLTSDLFLIFPLAILIAR